MTNDHTNQIDPLTLDWIIDNLKKDGYGSKPKVLRRLINANVDELITLHESIEKTIRLKLKG